MGERAQARVEVRLGPRMIGLGGGLMLASLLLPYLRLFGFDRTIQVNPGDVAFVWWSVLAVALLLMLAAVTTHYRPRWYVFVPTFLMGVVVLIVVLLLGTVANAADRLASAAIGEETAGARVGLGLWFAGLGGLCAATGACGDAIGTVRTRRRSRRAAVDRPPSAMSAREIEAALDPVSTGSRGELASEPVLTTKALPPSRRPDSVDHTPIGAPPPRASSSARTLHSIGAPLRPPRDRRQR